MEQNSLLFIYDTGFWYQVFGAVCGLINIYLNTKGNSWGWLIGLASVITSIIVYLQARLYAETGLQIVYGLSSIYGFINWHFLKKPETEGQSIKVLAAKWYLPCLVLFTALTAAIYYVLDTYTNGELKLCDAAITALSLVAQLLLARRIYENWHLWAIVNIACIAVYLYKGGLQVYAGLYTGYLILGLMGLFEWRKQLKQTQAANAPI